MNTDVLRIKRMSNPTTKNGNHLPNTTIQVIIEYDQITGAINVKGPQQLIGNMLFCYGLFEAAKDSIREFVRKQNEGRMIHPATTFPNQGV